MRAVHSSRAASRACWFQRQKGLSAALRATSSSSAAFASVIASFPPKAVINEEESFSAKKKLTDPALKLPATSGVVEIRPPPTSNDDTTTNQPSAVSSSSPQQLAPLDAPKLVTQALDHLTFLQDLHSCGVTLEDPCEKSLDRYLNLWLPLVNAVTALMPLLPSSSNNNDGTGLLVPPADVAWLWHCHRLAPKRYRAFCKKRFAGAIVDPTSAACAFAFQTPEEWDGGDDDGSPLEFSSSSSPLAAVKKQTREQWQRMFPNEPFFLDETTPQSQRGPVDVANGMDGYDLTEVGDRQATFLWHVSQPQFRDMNLLNNGVERYRKFLFLALARHNSSSMRNENNKTRIATGDDQPLCHFTTATQVWRKSQGWSLIPTYDIDLIWHTHMLVSTRQYIGDCRQIGGTKAFVNHDDSLTDRSKGGETDTGFQETCKLWQETFKEQYPVPQVMHRGNPPRSFYRKAWVPYPSSQTQSGSKYAYWKNCSEATGTFIEWGEFGEENDTRMPGYVFGEGRMGLGYYSLETWDAFKVLQSRLEHQQEEQRRTYKQLVDTPLSALDLAHLFCPSETREQLEKQLVETVNRLAYLQVRLQADGPNIPLKDEDVQRYRERGLRDNQLFSYYRNKKNNNNKDLAFVPGYWTTAASAAAVGSGSAIFTHMGAAENQQDAIVDEICNAAACGAETWHERHDGGSCGGSCSSSDCSTGGGGGSDCGGAGCGGGCGGD